MLALLQDYTIQNVAIGAALLGVFSGVLGCFAVLRKQSLLGDMISHAALPGVCLGFLLAGSRNLGFILGGALVTGALAALVMLLLSRRGRLKTDAATGVSLSVFFAIGIVLLTFIQGAQNASQGGLSAFLFGQAAAILRGDLWLIGAITALALGLVAAFWKEFKLVSFDPVFAASIGLPVVALELGLTVLIALSVVVGLQMVGVVLMAAMIVAPAVAARQWTHRLGTMVVLAALIGMASGVFGAVVSATSRGLSTGPVIILSVSAVVLVSLLFAPERGFAVEAVRHWRNRRRIEGQQVLTTLYQLAARHADPHYPAEQGTVDAYYGENTQRALAKLQTDGMVRPMRHEPEATPHWELTDAGRTEARRILGGLGRQEA